MKNLLVLKCCNKLCTGLENPDLHFVLLEEEDYLEGLVEFAQINAADLLVLPAAKGNLVNQLGSKEYLKTKASHQQIPLMLYGQPVLGNCSAHCAVCAP